MRINARYSLILDIGIARVRGILAETVKGKVPEIIKLEETKISLPKSLSLKYLYRKIMPAVFALAKALVKFLEETKKAKIRKSKILIFLPPPYYLSQIKIVKLKTEKPFLITENLIARILKEEAANFKRSLDSAQNLKDKEIEILEKEIIYSAVNGYGVKNIIQKTGIELELFLCLSACLNKILEDIKQEFSVNFGNLDIVFYTHPCVLFQVARKYIVKEKDFLLLEIDEETSEVLFVKDEALRETATFAKGTNFFIRRIAQSLDRSFEEGETLLAGFFRGVLAEEISQKISGIVEESALEWKETFKKTLEAFSENLYFPNLIVVSCPKTLFQEIKKILSGEDLKNYAIFGKPFSPKFIDLQDILPFLDIDPALKPKAEENPNLGLISLFAGLKN